tara:strand:- start:3072 stop:3299 length:228 start_codon:yes stop_codon:yes gene_type:complete
MESFAHAYTPNNFKHFKPVDYLLLKNIYIRDYGDKGEEFYWKKINENVIVEMRSWLPHYFNPPVFPHPFKKIEPR